MDYRQREAKKNFEYMTRQTISDDEWMAMQRAKDAAKRTRQTIQTAAPVTAPRVREYCHYCGQPATDSGPFGEPVCRQCGGRR